MKRFVRSTPPAMLAFLLLALMSASCKSAPPANIGPYLQNVTGDSVTICWETVQPTAGKIEIQKANGEKFNLSDNQTATFHEVKIGQLAPGTVYKYTVDAGGKKAAGAFRTDPGMPEPFNFIAYGDSRTGTPIHKELLKYFKKYSPALILNSGDFVENGLKQGEWNIFWSLVGPLARNIPYYPTLGNHEKNSDLYFHYFSLPDSGLGENAYSFAYAGAFFISLEIDDTIIVDTRQLKWLKKQLQAGQKHDFIFVFFHVPPFSSSKRAPNLQLRHMLTPVFEQYHVSAVFNGHDHFYERSELNGIPYIVTGGGGAGLYDFVNINPNSLVRIKENHFIVVRINGKQATFEVHNLKNRTIDSFSINSPR